MAAWSQFCLPSTELPNCRLLLNKWASKERSQTIYCLLQNAWWIGKYIIKLVWFLNIQNGEYILHIVVSLLPFPNVWLTLRYDHNTLIWQISKCLEPYHMMCWHHWPDCLLNIVVTWKPLPDIHVVSDWITGRSLEAMLYDYCCYLTGSSA